MSTLKTTLAAASIALLGAGAPAIAAQPTDQAEWLVHQLQMTDGYSEVAYPASRGAEGRAGEISAGAPLDSWTQQQLSLTDGHPGFLAGTEARGAEGRTAEPMGAPDAWLIQQLSLSDGG